MDRLAHPPLVSTEISDQVQFHIDLLLLCPPTPRFEESSHPLAHPEDHRRGERLDFPSYKSHQHSTELDVNWHPLWAVPSNIGWGTPQGNSTGTRQCPAPSGTWELVRTPSIAITKQFTFTQYFQLLFLFFICMATELQASQLGWWKNLNLLWCSSSYKRSWRIKVI